MGRTASGLIDDLGGRRVVADSTGARPGTVDVWKHRNRIPRAAWPEIQKAFPNVTLDQLLETETATVAADAGAAVEGEPLHPPLEQVRA